MYGLLGYGVPGSRTGMTFKFGLGHIVKIEQQGTYIYTTQTFKRSKVSVA